MKPIRTNKPVFFGDDGEVLKSGQIYIGLPNQWPISFPKTVTLQDSAGSQFAAEQPLKTNNQGRIEYNGKSVIALVDGDYSILVRDRNGVTVGEGYTPFVENAATGGGDEESVTQVGLLLEDIKLFSVTPGETVRNVGKITSLDGLGADWLVVSNTGNPSDDVDLIDFDNGTQGQRLNNQRYTKDTISVSEGGTGATTAAGARTALDLYSTSEIDADIDSAINDLASGAAGSPEIENAAIADDSVDDRLLGGSATSVGRDWALARIALATAGALGTYAFARASTGYTFGITLAGANLSASDNSGLSTGPTLSGTWRCMGQSSGDSATLWLRIA